jgi:hypothetical protein
MFKKVAKHRWDNIKYWIGCIDVEIVNVVDALMIYTNQIGIVSHHTESLMQINTLKSNILKSSGEL